MKLDNHKNDFIAETFHKKSVSQNKNLKKLKMKKSENTQIKLKKKESAE